MEQSLVLCEVGQGIAFVTLNHPEKRNALSRAMLSALREAFAGFRDDRAVRVVILRAHGPVFSAGHDLRELAEGSEKDHVALFALCTEVMEAIRKLPQPVIAQVEGLATAAGCQLAASCDLVVASEEASFGTPGVKIGLFCTTPGVALVRAVMPKKAMEMLLAGAPITAAAAERAGLVNRVVPRERLGEEALQLARQIAESSPQIIALGKKAFYQQVALDYPQAYEAAEKVMVQNACMAAAKEGFRAFLEKRRPRWPD
jgi:enoyl-CoA hydratase/carnithine racemase